MELANRLGKPVLWTLEIALYATGPLTYGWAHLVDPGMDVMLMLIALAASATSVCLGFCHFGAVLRDRAFEEVMLPVMGVAVNIYIFAMAAGLLF